MFSFRAVCDNADEAMAFMRGLLQAQHNPEFTQRLLSAIGVNAEDYVHIGGGLAEFEDVANITLNPPKLSVLLSELEALEHRLHPHSS